ncbi:MAG: J domain-containing protein [Desulfovibrio sp.]|nr:J domain-containing protein [Desulfovibrio sp.]
MAPRRTRQLSVKECYEILKLEKGADLQTLKTAYRRRAFELHPDLNPGNPEAGRQFQLLNEAYVALSAILKPAAEKKEKAAQTKTETGRQAQDSSGPKQEEKKEEPKQDKETSRASAAYAEQDVLRDLLNDPFARRVFEDIYSELARKHEPEKERPSEAAHKPAPEKKPAPPAEAPRKPAPLWNTGDEKGVAGMLKGWFRKQFDEEQTLKMPAARLRPGAKIRLQIRKGFSEDATSVEVTLPRDFSVGKPMRLRGLGKKMGRWQGDLYLTIYNE